MQQGSQIRGVSRGLWCLEGRCRGRSLRSIKLVICSLGWPASGSRGPYHLRPLGNAPAPLGSLLWATTA